MLARPVSLHDIDDAEAFVRSTIRRKVRVIPYEEMDEMICEGLVILVDLARLYDPERDRRKKAQAGHVCRGPRCCKPSFAGYASFLLPKKLKEAYYANKPECMLKTKADGTRSYVILESACSIEERNDKSERTQSRHNVMDLDSTRRVGNFIPVPEVHPA